MPAHGGLTPFQSRPPRRFTRRNRPKALIAIEGVVRFGTRVSRSDRTVRLRSTHAKPKSAPSSACSCWLRGKLRPDVCSSTTRRSIAGSTARRLQEPDCTWTKRQRRLLRHRPLRRRCSPGCRSSRRLGSGPLRAVPSIPLPSLPKQRSRQSRRACVPRYRAVSLRTWVRWPWCGPQA